MLTTEQQDLIIKESEGNTALDQEKLREAQALCADIEENFSKYDTEFEMKNKKGAYRNDDEILTDE